MAHDGYLEFPAFCPKCDAKFTSLRDLLIEDDEENKRYTFRCPYGTHRIWIFTSKGAKVLTMTYQDARIQGVDPENFDTVEDHLQ